MTTRARPLRVDEPSHLRVRLTAMVFAVLLGMQCLWLLAAELFQPSIDRLPTDSVSAAGVAKQREVASLAASIGAIRGDLWAQSAYTYADLVWGEQKAGAKTSVTAAVPSARANLDQALRNAPCQSGAWLLLAGLALRYPSPSLDATAVLKMSYYTGPSEQYLAPQRLRLALQLEGVNDIEMRQFVSRDIRFLLARKRKFAIADAYAAASADGKSVVEQTIKNIDPSALDVLRAGAHALSIPN